MRARLGLLVVLIAALLCAGPAEAARRVALVIGNQQYEMLPKLEKANADAKAYADLFKEQQFDQVLFKLDLTRLQLDEAVADFVDAIQPGDTAVFVYAGHGWSDGNQNYLVGVDAPLTGSQNFLKRISMPIQNGADGILDEIQAKGASLKIAIIDACRDNPFEATDGTRSIGISRGFNRMPAPPEGTFAVFSAGAGQTALDRLADSDTNPNGVFTRVFVPLLRANVTLLDATKEAQGQVYELAKSVGHDQQPAFYDETRGNKVCLSGACLSGDVTVATNDTPEAPMGGIEDQFWIAVRESDSIDLLKTYTAKYPDGKYAEIATAKIAALQTGVFAAAESGLGLTQSDYVDIGTVLSDAGYTSIGPDNRYMLNRDAIAKYQKSASLASTGYLDLSLLQRFRTEAPGTRQKWEEAALGDDTTKKLRVIRALQELGYYPKRDDDGSYNLGTNTFEEKERTAIRSYQASIGNLEADDHIDQKALDALMDVSVSKDNYPTATELTGRSLTQQSGDWNLVQEGDYCLFYTVASTSSDEYAVTAPLLALKFEDVTKSGNNYTWRLWLDGATGTYLRNPWTITIDGGHTEEGMKFFSWDNISQDDALVRRLQSGHTATGEYESLYSGKTETAEYSLAGFSKIYSAAKQRCVFDK